MKLRAIVLEDDDEVRALFASILSSRGYEVLAFPDPLFCPSALTCHCPCTSKEACTDIVVTDLEMPNVTGISFLENQVANGCRLPPQNAAILSGGWTEESRTRARKLGVTMFDKPVDIADLEKWLDGCEKRIAAGRKLATLDEVFGKRCHQ